MRTLFERNLMEAPTWGGDPYYNEIGHDVYTHDIKLWIYDEESEDLKFEYPEIEDDVHQYLFDSKYSYWGRVDYTDRTVSMSTYERDPVKEKYILQLLYMEFPRFILYNFLQGKLIGKFRLTKKRVTEDMKQPYLPRMSPPSDTRFVYGKWVGTMETPHGIGGTNNTFIRRYKVKKGWAVGTSYEDWKTVEWDIIRVHGGPYLSSEDWYYLREVAPESETVSKIKDIARFPKYQSEQQYREYLTDLPSSKLPEELIEDIIHTIKKDGGIGVGYK